MPTSLPQIATALTCLVLSAWLTNYAFAMERVSFESAHTIVGPLQLRLARERGQPVERAAVDTIEGYLVKPAGDGPFPAVVLLHGCSGLSADFKAGARNSGWLDRLAAWGYAALFVDSFSTRGIAETCTTKLTQFRVADAYGALAFLSRQRFVDNNRIALMGFSAGAIVTLSAAGHRDFELYEEEADRKFRAAIAFYPYCAQDGRFTVPTLILIGELDDWTPASFCRAMMAKRKDADALVTLIVYPDAHHVFDSPSLKPGVRVFGHWEEYNPIAARNAVREVRRFLAEKLSP
jgi:dienelactone hydrolase